MLKVFDFEKTPIVDIVNEILVDASSRGASDIHFDPKDDILQIRIRIDGRLINYATVPNEYVKNLITRIKIISGMNITESRLPQDGAIKGKVKDIELDLRVSSINTSKGEKVVIRILDYTLSLNGIENLGFSDYNYKKVIEMINEPNGIILVTGATGTGKTTTVYSMLQRLSNEATNIMSIEDPVEMDIENVNQIQVNPEIGLTFATALRSILRQDPNIIMIGEIRDSDTATIAIRASVTGHLVLSTLHTNDSLSTIERLLDMDVEKYLLAEALEGIISQKLARRLCPHCKKLRKTTQYEKELIKKTLDMDVDEIYEAVGCEKCNRGYKGRIAFQEVLKIDQKIQDALGMNIRKDKLRNLVYNNEVITLLQDGMIKVLRGDTTIEELLRLVEFDDESIITYNMSKDILDTELNKKIETIDNDIKDEENMEFNEEDELIVPDTNDVVIDSIDTNIDDNNDNNDNNDESIDIDNMESLDNDDEFIEKIDEVIATENNSKNDEKTNNKEKNNIIKKEKKKKNDTAKKEKKKKKNDNDDKNKQEINIDDDIKDSASSNSNNTDIPNTSLKDLEKDKNDIDKKKKTNENEKKINNNKKKKKDKKDTIVPETNDIIETKDKKQEENKNDIEVNSDDTFITKIKKYVKSNNKDNENNLLNDDSNIITDQEISELEDVIKTTKVDNNSTDKEIANNENNLNITNDLGINNNEMAKHDFNTNFIDKTYDDINNTSEIKGIEKDNIDYEKVEKLESIQEEIGNRFSRMMNKKRYRKTKKDE